MGSIFVNGNKLTSLLRDYRVEYICDEVDLGDGIENYYEWFDIHERK